MNSERPAGRRWANFYRYHDAVLASDLSHAELRVALVIARCANADGLAWPALATIQERSGRGRSTVLEAIKALEVNGWLTVERQGARARFLGEGNRYRLHLAAEQVPPAGPARANDEAPPQVREPGPDGAPSGGAHQVQESGPDDQVQDPGLLRSRIAQPSGPGSPVFASPAPLSVKEPLKEPERGAGAGSPGRAHAPPHRTPHRLPHGLDEHARSLAVAGYERRQVAPAKACRELTSPVWADIARFGRDTGALRGVTPESVILESMRVFFEDERMRAKGWPIAFLAQNPSEFFNRADHSRLVVNEPISERVRAVLLDAYRSAHEAELHTAWPGPVPDDEPSVEVIVDWCAAQRVPLEAARAVVEGAFKFDAWRRYGWPWSRIAADPGHCAALSTRSLAGQLGEGDERPAHELIPKVDVTTPLTEEERRLSW